MRCPSALALSVVAMLFGVVEVSAQTAVVLDLATEIRGLEFNTKDLIFSTEDLAGGVQALEIKQSDLAIEETETEIRIELAADVLFDFDSADLRPEAEKALQNVAEIIQANPAASVRVEGHTDAKGSESYNQALSEQRAASVRDWLLVAEGLEATDFSITGFGESKPAADNEKPDGSDDPEGRQKNRRVEIVVEKH